MGRAKQKKTIIILSLLSASFLVFFLSLKVEHARVSAPNGKYAAIASSRRFKNYIPSFIGQGSDKSGYIELVDQNGESLGEALLPSMSMLYDIKWQNSRAEITAIVDWEFNTRECSYWNKQQTRKTPCF